MTTVLQIDASASLETSKTRKATQSIVAGLNPDKLIVRDLAVTPLPHVTDGWVTARLTPIADQTPQEAAILAQSDQLIAELVEADTIVIGLPLYNFGLPASLKAWIDLIARPKVTFEYTADGPKGLLTGKKAIVAFTSGGVPMGAPVDYASPHMRNVLEFIGITDVTFKAAGDT